MSTAPWARLRDTLLLVARLDSADADVRRTAEVEVEALRQQFADGPSPGETFGKRVAQILRDEAERLRRAGGPGG